MYGINNINPALFYNCLIYHTILLLLWISLRNYIYTFIFGLLLMIFVGNVVCIGNYIIGCIDNF